jgi:hypothetical protein
MFISVSWRPITKGLAALMLVQIRLSEGLAALIGVRLEIDGIQYSIAAAAQPKMARQ